jgi:hypothetical protein
LADCDEQLIADTLFNFTVTVYHVKDWLIKHQKATEKEVYAALDNSDALRACRDLANASKHVELDPSSPSYKNHPPIVNGPATHSLSASTQWPSIVRLFQALTGQDTRPWYLKVPYDNGSKVRVDDIAESAIADWESFFQSRGL